LNLTSWSVNNLLSCKVSISSVESSNGSSICLLNYDLRMISSCSSTKNLSSTTLKVFTNLALHLKVLNNVIIQLKYLSPFLGIFYYGFKIVNL
jgi:hypothetical protein